jgi:hypothetical protein
VNTASTGSAIRNTGTATITKYRLQALRTKGCAKDYAFIEGSTQTLFID